MEIVKYKKIKNNVYEISLSDNRKLLLYDDVIIRFNLLNNKSIEPKLLSEVLDYNNNLEAYYLSIKYLNNKLRSEIEIKKYLEKKEYSKLLIENTISKLKQEGYLDKKVYISSYINDNYNFTNFGPEKIKQNLLKLGFDIADIDVYLNQDYKQKAHDLIDKKVKLNHKLSTYALKQNINIYLINLGYPKEVYEEYLDEISCDDKNLINKDYTLLLKKYKNKYQDKKLLLIIRDKLYKKGYNIDEINEVINNELL